MNLLKRQFEVHKYRNRCFCCYATIRGCTTDAVFRIAELFEEEFEMKKQKNLFILLGVFLFLFVLFKMPVASSAASTTYATHYHPVCGSACSCANTHSDQDWQP